MTVTIPDKEPAEVTAGDSIDWKRDDLANYLPADGWALKYVLINATSKIEIPATTSGAGYAVSVTPTDSAKYAAGEYKWQAIVTNAGSSKRATVGSGVIEVLPDYESAATLETRSHVKITLDNIQAVIEKRATVDQESYTIMGRQLKRTPIEELLKMRDKYKSLYAREVNEENSKNGRSNKNRIVAKL